jgi:hypothetical protein
MTRDEAKRRGCCRECLAFSVKKDACRALGDGPCPNPRTRQAAGTEDLRCAAEQTDIGTHNLGEGGICPPC